MSVYKFGIYQVNNVVADTSALNKEWYCYENRERIPANVTLIVKDEYQLFTADDITISNGWNHIVRSITHYVSYIKDGATLFTITYTENSCLTIANTTKMTQQNIRTGIQFALLLGLAGKAFGLHGVTVICGDKVLILSAPSGTGKSTLGRLLHDHCGAAIVNGDFALLTPEQDGSLMFEPTPFCGTSGVCHNYRLKVDRIVFLEQAVENTFASLPPMQALTRLLSNTFVPTWDEEKALAVQQNALQAAASVPMNRFAFAPTREAAEMFHALVTQE